MDPSVWPQYVVEPQYIEGYFEERVGMQEDIRVCRFHETIAFP